MTYSCSHGTAEHWLYTHHNFQGGQVLPIMGLHSGAKAQKEIWGLTHLLVVFTAQYLTAAKGLQEGNLDS